MKILPMAQGSTEWLEARSCIPTASEFKNLITPKGEIRTGEMPKSYLAEKVASWWQGYPLPQPTSFGMEQGNLLEDQAIPWLSLRYGIEVERVGLVTTDDGLIGCSPDGLIGADSGVEVKCPAADTHTGYLLSGGLPKDYKAQVQGALYVTGRPTWRFLSYRRHFPDLLLTIEPDEVFQKNLAEALAEFLERFAKAKRAMIDANGGEEPQRTGTDSTWQGDPGLLHYTKPDGLPQRDPDDVGIIP